MEGEVLSCYHWMTCLYNTSQLPITSENNWLNASSSPQCSLRKDSCKIEAFISFKPQQCNHRDYTATSAYKNLARGLLICKWRNSCQINLCQNKSYTTETIDEKRIHWGDKSYSHGMLDYVKSSSGWQKLIHSNFLILILLVWIIH